MLVLREICSKLESMRQNAILDPLCQDTAGPKLSFSPNENFWQEGCSWCARSPILGVIVPDLHGELVAKKSRIETVDFERPLCLELDWIVTEYIISAKTKTFGKREGIDCFKNEFLESFAKILMVNSLARNLVMKYSKNFALRWDSNFIFPVRSAGIRSLIFILYVYGTNYIPKTIQIRIN